MIKECDYYKLYNDLRENNGVDISNCKFNSFFGYNRNQGYVMANNQNEVSVCEKIVENNWENGILNLTKFIAYICGRGLYCKSTDNYSIIENDFKQLMTVLENKLFDFDMRTEFSQSYNIPEQIFPVLFKYTTEYVCDYARDYINNF